MYTTSNKLPKVPFPKFVGENPKLWQTRSERYFDMHGIDKSLWVPVSTMYFDDAAARWLQSVDSKVSSIGWEDFCMLVHDRFGRDQQELLIRHSFTLGRLAQSPTMFSVFLNLSTNYQPTPLPLILATTHYAS